MRRVKSFRFPFFYFFLFNFAFTASAADWRSEWERTVAAAKKEGQVNVYISAWSPVIDAGVFQRAYPEIKVVTVTGRGAQMAQRLLAERRAGKYLADVVTDGINPVLTIFHANAILDPIKPALMLPEVTDESHWWQGRHHYPDPEGQYVFRYTGIPQQATVSYNVKLVNPKELTSHRDILLSKWKGKITARDIRDPGPGNGMMRFLYYNPEIGSEFIRRLFSEMEITLFRDFRQGADWLASGKFALCLFCSDIDKAKRQGLPVDSLELVKGSAGLVSHYGTLGLVHKAPHPAAAKVFINWFLSREGQLTLQKALAKAGDTVPDSLRVDIPKDDVALEDKRREGVKYVDLDSRQEWLDRRPILKLFEEALAEAAKRKR